ncbi:MULTISPECIES: GNAT family N-acetyltransferase [Yersinia]|uniref:Putative acetyltransferase n=1 Tax=Yersinia intermedia TaxID=631 RepID=A0A0H5LR94_YERIN|nr:MULTISPECIES: GNAT family N-acetyltransferase [Yersinia]CRY53603.1 putative acetyltransferase [Yersinia intermedia]
MLQPHLETPRLILRPFQFDDADRVYELVNDPLISDVTANIPHPYSLVLAKEWIASHSSNWEESTLAAFAIIRKDDQGLIGAISLMDINCEKAEVGYWLGQAYWNQGYCSEACVAISLFGFNTLNLSAISGRHLHRNPASGKVLIKNGFQFIGSRHMKTKKREHDELVDFYQLIKKI